MASLPYPFTIAAEATRRRIRRDRGAVPEPLKPLLENIERHLFEEGYDVNRMRRECKVYDPTLLQHFRSALDRNPFRYIEDRRMETACRILVESDLMVWQIAELLGYRSPQVFSRAFVRWSGERPTAYGQKRRDPDLAIIEDQPLERRVERVVELLEEALELLKSRG